VFCIQLCLFASLAKAQESAVKPQGIYSSNFVIDGIPRNITFYIPLGYGKHENYPVVLLLHAEGETGKAMAKKYGGAVQALADSVHAIVVYPDAINGHWNTKMGSKAATDTINDAGFLSIMFDYFMQQYHGDPTRAYALGFYSGGEMAWRLGCYSHVIAAIAPFMANVQSAAKECAPVKYFNGSAYLPSAGKKFSNEAISAAFAFLMGVKKQP
jgi:poly(3-hydroxybutyrate) depolymerase